VFRIIAVEREYGSGGGTIARKLAQQLGWKLWDQSFTEELARIAHVDCPEMERRCERLDSPLYRLSKVFWRGSYERASQLQTFDVLDADSIVNMMGSVVEKIAKEGNAVIVGRGAPYFLRERSDTLTVFFYASRPEKIRRVMRDGKSRSEAEDLVDHVDRDRIAFVKHYFNADWPYRPFYDLMVNTEMGDAAVIDIVSSAMQRIQSASESLARSG
jgi:cytidylate kinase